MSLSHLATLAVLVVPTPVWAQESTFYAQSDLVLLDVGVKDRSGGFISNLKKENFRVFENGQLQTISQFSSDDLPVTAGLVIDNSGSMRGKRAEVITAGLAFDQASNRNDEIFVAHFNDRVRSSLPKGLLFTGDISTLRNALFSGGAPDGRTALYDAIVFSLKRLESGKQDRKVLVLVSDGGDNASTHDFNDVMPAVRKSFATIYTIGIFDEDDPDRNPGLLRRLARISGGEVFFPQHVPEVIDICRQIAKDIRNRYTIGYVPVRRDEKNALRTIKVDVVGTDRKAIVHARTGYLLPQQREAKRE